MHDKRDVANLRRDRNIVAFVVSQPANNGIRGAEIFQTIALQGIGGY